MNIHDIPREIIENITHHCSISDVSKFLGSRKSLNNVMNDGIFWKRRYLMDYNTTEEHEGTKTDVKEWPERLIITEEWKTKYRHRFLTLKNWKTGKFRSTKLYYQDNGVMNDLVFSSASISRHIHMCVNLILKLVVSVSIRGHGVVWSLETGKALGVLTHGEKITSAAIFGNKVVTAGNDGVIRLWDLLTFVNVQFAIPTNEVSCIILHSDKIYCGNETGQLIVVDIKSSSVHVLNAHELAITCIEANAKYIATGSLDKSVTVWSQDLTLLESYGFVTQIYCISLVGSELFVGYSKGLHHIHIIDSTSTSWFNSTDENDAVLSVKATEEKVYFYIHLGRLFHCNKQSHDIQQRQ